MEECKDELINLARKNRVRLCWVPGDQSYEGNEKTDELTRLGFESSGNALTLNGRIPLSKNKLEIDQVTKNAFDLKWARATMGLISRKF